MKTRWAIRIKGSGRWLSTDCTGYTPRLPDACLFGSKKEVQAAVEDGVQEEAIRLNEKQLEQAGV